MHMLVADELAEGVSLCSVCGKVTADDELCETDNMWMCGVCYDDSPEGQLEWEEVCKDDLLDDNNELQGDEDLW